MSVPPDVIAHCNAHKHCKGCPLRTCEAPTYQAGDPRWGEWLGGRIKTIREAVGSFS